MEENNLKKASPGRTRFYSNQYDEDNIKPLRTQEDIPKDLDCDSVGSVNSHQICKDPGELLDGISDMFINSELGLNYSKDKKGELH
jgi:hypothetical protein